MTSSIQMLSFVVVSTVVLVLGGVYLSKRSIQKLPLSPSKKRLARFTLWSLIAIEWVVPVLMRSRWINRETEFYGSLMWFGYFALGFLGLWFTAQVMSDVLGLLLKKPMQRSRRLFLKDGGRGVVLGAAFAGSGAGLQAAVATPSVERVRVPLPRLPQAWNGLTIAQISDLHVGPTIRREFVEEVVKTTMALKPDLIAVTGDLVDGLVDELRFDMDPLADLKAPYGVFYCTGNHEFYWGVDSWVERCRELGWTPLTNTHQLIYRDGVPLAVGGVWDHRGSDFGEQYASSPAQAFEGVGADVPRILLAHQPRTAVVIGEETDLRVDLQLTGHTHAGQFFPFSLLVDFFQPYTQGLYHLNRDRKLYVNRGTGYWGPPNRLGVPSEISFLQLET